MDSSFKSELLIKMKFKYLLSIIIIAISIIPLLDLFHPGLPITHDSQDHVARIANFYLNLEEGNIIPRWAQNLNWGYGHPILMFLYPLPSYFASLFHSIGISLVDSTKIVFGLSYLISGLTMYLWINEFLGSRAAFISCLLYLFAPYRFIDLYVRGAIGEHIAFIFLPLVAYFILKLSKKYSKWYLIGGSFSLAGLLLSHNAISLMFLPLVFLYAFYLIWQNKNKKPLIVSLCSLIILGFGLVSFFWMPAFFEGKYTLRDIVTKGEYASRFVDFKDFIYGQWNYGISGQFSVQIGIVQLFMAILAVPAIFLLKRKNNKLWILTMSLFIVFLTTLFLMTQYSKFVWDWVTTLQKFQFPWRFLSLTVFITAVFGGIVVNQTAKKFQLIACYLILAALIFCNKDYWHAKDYLIINESFFTGIYLSTTDTGESSPIWSVRFMEKQPKSHIEILSGNVKTEELSRTSTNHKYKVNAQTEVRLRENTLYFPGWEVLVDGKKTNIEFQDPGSRGLMTFFVEKGEHNIDLIFKETKLRLIADIISLLSFVIILILGILKKTSIWQHYR